MGLTVSQVRTVCPSVLELELRDLAGAPLAAWSAGAHIDLRVGPDLVRQYSLCGDPADQTAWTIAVHRDPASRGGSSWLHEHARPGLELGGSAPRNNFPLVPAERYLFIAGGIGVTPFLSLVPGARASGAAVHVVLGGSAELIGAFAARLGGDVETHPDTDGLIPVDRVIGAVAAGTAVYCCGPTGLVAAVRAALDGRPDLALYVEQFAPAGPPAGEDRPVTVELATSGITLEVPAGTSILDAVTERGVFVASSCREGTCGTCEVVVLAGEPDHRDTVIDPGDPDRDGSMMVCVSRARGERLLLDL